LPTSQEEIGSGVCGGGKVNGIRWGHTQLAANPRIVVCGFDGKGNNLGDNLLQQAPRLGGNLRRAFTVGTGKDLSESEGAGNELISTLFHARADRAHPLGVLRVVFQPVDEEHGVPIDPAHWLSVGG
jgi:hypothetical protein